MRVGRERHVRQLRTLQKASFRNDMKSEAK
jgi:hypothetical protein